MEGQLPAIYQTPHHKRGGRRIPTHQTPHHRGGKEGGGFPPTRPHATGQEGGRGIPAHQTPHYRTTTHTTEGGAASQTIWGGAAERVTVYMVPPSYLPLLRGLELRVFLSRLEATQSILPGLDPRFKISGKLFSGALNLESWIPASIAKVQYSVLKFNTRY